MLPPPDAGGSVPTDPLAGLALPPGDPGGLRTTAARLQSAATAASSTASRQQRSAMATIGVGWVGGAASTTGKNVQGMVWSAQTFSSSAGDASAWLLTAASGWDQAKALWQQAQSLASSAMAEEAAHRSAGASAMATAAAHNDAAAVRLAQMATAGTDGFVSPDRARARTLALQAIDDFNRATVKTTAQLATLGGPAGAAGAIENLKIDAAIADVTNPSAYAAIRSNLENMLRDPATISAGDIQKLEAALGGLTPAERGLLVDDLAGNEVITNLGRALGDEHPLSTWDQLFGGGDAPLGRNDLLRLYSLLLSNASAGVVATLAGKLPGVDPSLSGVQQWDKQHTNDRYLPIPGSIMDPGGGLQPGDVSQGGIGDCYFLSSLIATARVDPTFVQNHIHDNGNGTTTVTLYQDGKPVQITVTNTIPTSTNPGSGYGAGPDGATGSQGSWPSLYEKAYAQLQGGYGVIDQGGYGSQGLSAVTGAPTTTVGTSNSPTSWIPLVGGAPNPPDVSVDQLRSLWASNHPIVVGTNTTGGDSEHSTTLIQNHEYVVQSVSSNGTVTLRNPWDPSDTPTLPWSKIQSQLNEVVWTNGTP